MDGGEARQQAEAVTLVEAWTKKSIMYPPAGNVGLCSTTSTS
jgi:hypothetical protein